MSEPLGIALELAAKRRAFAARLSPQARRLAFPYQATTPAAPRTALPPIPATEDGDILWPTAKRIPLHVKARRLRPKAKVIVAVVAAHWDATDALIYAATKRHVAVRPRRAAMCLMRTLLEASLPTIGKLLGRDHTTIKTGLLRHADDYDRDADYRRRFDAAEAEVRALFSENAAVTSDTTAAAGGERDGCTEQPSPTPPANLQRRAA